MPAVADIRRIAGEDALWFDASLVTSQWSKDGSTLAITRLGNLVFYDGTNYMQVSPATAVFLVDGLGLPVPSEILVLFAEGEI
jgi:hypothetical protein